ncbi:hypothetical protein [Paludisphaera rhizosphaerae]|uniref:hypothetical protein n=1 Tax=Paludisphaera rhizosphaerae TaxID=2711216 RepID=UPI0013EA6759|nr:hypothetical protein [Paludisphaera rhizosphaerae]
MAVKSMISTRHTGDTQPESDKSVAMARAATSASGRDSNRSGLEGDRIEQRSGIRAVGGFTPPYASINETERVVSFCRLQFFSLIYLQKFAIPAGSMSISIPMLIMMAGLGRLVIQGGACIEMRRGIAFAAFVSACLTSQMFVTDSSWLSMIFVVVLNAWLLLVRDIDSRALERIATCFVRFMYLPGGIVFLQHLCYVTPLGDIFSMDRIVPSQFLLKGFVYTAEYGWKSGIMRPNGFFFLEPSFVSMYLAAAAITALRVHGDRLRAAFFAAACIGSTGATGMLMLAVGFLAVLVRRRLKTIAAISAAATIAVVVAFASGLGSQMSHRFEELSTEKSSGHGRLMMPVTTLIEILISGKNVCHGLGAGTITDDTGGSAWPILKVVYEYGVLAGIGYAALIALSLYRSPIPELTLALFVVFQFTGGYLVQPMLIGLLVLLCTGFRCTAAPQGDRGMTFRAAAL